MANAPLGRALSLHEVALGALHEHGNDEDCAQLVQAGEALLRCLAERRLRPEPLRIARFAEPPRRLGTFQHRQFSGKSLIRLLPLE